MIVTKSIKKVRMAIKNARQNRKRIGFVPTMGALHRGHLYLFEKARKENDYLIASIFINPLQFCPGEDFKKYPRNFNRDKKLLAENKVDLLFYPQADKIYDPAFSTYVEETELSRPLCGKSRPGHFRGVTTIVAKLFNIVSPDTAYLGQKDYQQALIIKKMVKDLNFSVKIKVLPTIREKDNLALSSRNAYLRAPERRQSRSIYQSLSLAKRMAARGQNEPKKIITAMKKNIKKNPDAVIDYIQIRDARNLKKVKKISRKTLVAVAVYFGGTRLIDNCIIKG